MIDNNKHLGVNTFVASSHGNDQCGTNGLPLTPNSTVIIGRFQYLKTIEHCNLCRYIDIRKGTHERLLVVSEYYERSFESLLNEKKLLSVEQIQQWTQQILYGLIYLQEKRVHVRNLSLKNIRLTQSDQTIKIQNYGLWHMTQYGTCVSFPIGDPFYLAPECFTLDLAFKALIAASNSAYESEISDPANAKSCVWSLGIILLELCLGQRLYGSQPIAVPMSTSVRCLKLNVRSALDILLRQNGLDQDERLKRNTTQFFLPMIRKCLSVQVQDRPTFVELLRDLDAKSYVSPVQRSLQLTLFNGVTPVLDHNLDLSDFKQLDTSPFRCRTIDQIYYLWKLAGGDLTTVSRNAGLIKISPSISKISKFVTDHGDVYGLQRDINTLFDDTSYELSLKELENRFNEMPIEILHPLLEGGDCEFEQRQEEFDQMYERQPLAVRENDFEYQFLRLTLFERLLASYPYQKQRLHTEARKDIPPLYRAFTWAALLEISSNVNDVYNRINKDDIAPAVIRQIEVDIPRCHQYDELLSSPEGHQRMKNVLKAWIASHTNLVYWQGLDSLCAPFVYLNFNNEALAYASLTAFIPKYLNNFFLKDNSLIINEYLAVFSHLIAFHHPDLSNRLETIGFIPDLYAIPWFLTVFAHVFPLNKIFHLWDMLLLGGSSFPLCIGVAILTQLKPLLLKADFNECILLFSELPEIDIERCVRDSIDIFASTPRACTYREHASDVPNYQVNNELDMDPFPLADLKFERCPRISANDVIELNDLKAPTASLKTSKLLLIDIRSPDDYIKSALPASVNIAYEKAFDNQNRIIDTRLQTLLDQHRSLVKVVIGNKNHKQAVDFTNNLIMNNASRVCLLHKGIDVFKTTGLLYVPTPSDLS
ncbi:unnamed protein product [Adineta ricciae]|uniref:TBC domain-containing protein kinase-like protein n=1 Tax=Adineta ricciae TaxID=249248 RepID=A0A814SS08_ADIRI|nr:unnamed protein product [Adineta ricciae]CAF1555735.1 unnamed protein product [Adineta ricciae]